LANCADEYYSEGRVKTVNATEVTANAATLNGSIVVVTEGSKANLNIKSRGFVYGTSRNDLNRTVSDQFSGEGNFSCDITYLMPNTKYYARALAVMELAAGEKESTSPTYYGNIIDFTTEDGEAPPPPPDYIVLQIMVQKNDISAGTSWDNAFSLCAASTVGGYSDWRLPTRGELQALYNNRTTIGGFSTTWYWTGESYNNSYLYALDFGSGTIDYQSSSSSYRVRAVRTLP